MENLAGVYANCQITSELNIAGVPIVVHGQILDTEPITNLTGQLGDFKFCRAWYYWIVEGYVPIEIAKQLYADSVGKTDVRVSGHCGCPPPEEWAAPTKEIQNQIWKNLGLREDMSLSQKMDFICSNTAKFQEEEIKYDQYIDHYHIDSQEGLNLFVRVLRENNLV